MSARIRRSLSFKTALGASSRTARAPEIALEFADHVYAARKNIQIGRAVFAAEVTFDLLDARKDVLFDARIRIDPPLIEEFGDRFGRRERPLSRGGVDERLHPSRPVPLPAEFVARCSDGGSVKVDILSRRVMLGDDVHVPVKVHAVPVGGQRVVQPGIDRDLVLPLERDLKGRDDVHPLVELARTRTLHESDILRYRFVKTSLIPSQNIQPEDPFMPNQSDIPYRSLETAVWVPYFTQAFECLHGTGLVAMTGLQLAARRIAEGGDYVILGKPSRISDYTPHFLWHVRVDKDPAVQWLRGMFLSEKGRFVDPDDFVSLEP